MANRLRFLKHSQTGESVTGLSGTTLIHKNTPTPSIRRRTQGAIILAVHRKTNLPAGYSPQSKGSSLPLFSEYHLLSGPLRQAVHLAEGCLHPGDAAVLHQVAPHRARPTGLQREDR